MASSKSSLGPHDRRPYLVRAKCTFPTQTGRPCPKPPGLGGKICNYHKGYIERRAADPSSSRSHVTPLTAQQGGHAKRITGTARLVEKMAVERAAEIKADEDRRDPIAPRKRGDPRPRSSTGTFVVNALARDALAKLGTHIDPTIGLHVDPKQILLDSVSSAWRQRQVWEAMLNSVPEEDWAMVGSIPVPGSVPSARGSRIEAIQKHLSEATKTAARTSKLAIDAGIEERIVKLAEEQSALIADTVRAALQAGILALVASGFLTKANEPAALEAALTNAASRLRVLASSGGPAGQSNNRLDSGGLGIAGGGEIIEGIAHEIMEKERARG